jgi:hypothetical protein
MLSRDSDQTLTLDISDITQGPVAPSGTPSDAGVISQRTLFHSTYDYTNVEDTRYPSRYQMARAERQLFCSVNEYILFIRDRFGVA